MSNTAKTMHVSINDANLEFNIVGETLKGEDKVLLFDDIDIIQHTDFKQIGFEIFDLLSNEEFETIKAGFTEIIKGFMEEEGIQNLENFELINYHKFIPDDATHLRVVSHIQQGVDIQKFPFPASFLDEKIGKIVKMEVESECRELNHHTFSIRIVRPNILTDNNPPHRDVWLNHLRNAANIYLPICGSDENSALPILPYSHHWKESEIERTAAGAEINGIKFNVPCVVGSDFGLKMVRPNPKERQVMIFSPYLIHGGGYNLNTDTTRVSLEMRFWKKH